MKLLPKPVLSFTGCWFIEIVCPKINIIQPKSYYCGQGQFLKRRQNDEEATNTSVTGHRFEDIHRTA